MSASPRRDAQDDLVDAERRVVLELAGVRDRPERHDAQRSTDRGRSASQAACSSGSAARIPRPPIGIQPSAYSAMWANIFGPAAPPMSTGGPAAPGRRAGFGHDHDGARSTCLPWNSAASSRPELRIASMCSRATSRRSGIVDAVVLDLVGVPAEADAEDEASARELVEGRDGLRGDDRLALRDEADAGAEQHALGRPCRGHGQRDERVERALVLLARARRRPSAAECGATRGCACARGGRSSAARAPRLRARNRPAASSGRS